MIDQVVCSACGETDEESLLPDNGWVMNYDLFGYYNGFDDKVEVLLGNKESREWLFCHDCVVKFLETFPLLAADIGANCHPCQDEEPCCRHAWKATDDFAESGEILTAWSDKTWKRKSL